MIVVGTVEGVKAATKVKMDLKKPITQLACHPRHPVLVSLLFGISQTQLALVMSFSTRFELLR